MFVNCPHCQSLIAVDAVTGAAPEHCPYCDCAIAVAPAELEAGAEGHMQADPSADPAVPTASTTGTPEADIGAQVDEDDRAPEIGAAVDARMRGDTSSQVPQAAPAAQKSRKTAHPSFARHAIPGTATTRRARWPWPVVILLMLALLLQLTIADRASLAAHPRWRAAITRLCTVLRCDIPPWRETDAFTMLARDVHAHPAIADALRIRAAFRNDARWPQPWPQLVVTLSDASGRVTGSRTFSADEYLGDAPTQKLIATGQTAAVALEIREPAPDTVSFSFDFR